MTEKKHKWQYVILAVLVGVAVALQSKVNGELGHRIGDGLFAAIASFIVGLILLIIILLINFQQTKQSFALLGSALTQGTLRWPLLLSGAVGAAVVFLQGALVNTLGLALFTIAIVSGQNVGGIIADMIGAGGVRRRPSAARILGAVIMLIAVALVASLDFSLLQNAFWLIGLPFLIGGASAWQHVAIGQVRHVAGVQISTVVNFVVGLALLLIGAVIALFFVPFPSNWPSEPWLYIGGALGVFLILGIAVVVRHIGVLLLSLAMTAGQLVTSVLVDLIFPVGRIPDIWTYLGVVLAILGVWLVSGERESAAGKAAAA